MLSYKQQEQGMFWPSNDITSFKTWLYTVYIAYVFDGGFIPLKPIC